MLNISTNDRPPSIQERVSIMKRNIDKGGVPVDYDRLVEYLAHTKVEQYELGSKLLALTKSNSAYFKEKDFKEWILKHNLTKGFNLTKNNNISFDAKSIETFLNTNAYGDEINNVVKLFNKFKYLGSQVLQIPSILEQYKPCGLESDDGRRLILIKPDVVPQNTGRFGLVNPGFMNLPRYMKDLVVAPKGWTIVSADSGQIEPKIIYGFYLPDPQINKLINVYRDAYYGVLHYCRMPIENIQNHIMDFEPVDITNDLKELRQRLKTYGNGVMYGATSNPDKDPLKQAYIDRIGFHPLRIEWGNETKAQIMSGQKVFYTLFGTPIDIYKSDKVINANDDKARQLALEHCAINNPIQGTAGDLMGFSLKASDELIAKKAPNSWITKFVHDEGQYCIHNSEVDYVLEEISGHTSYNIDDKVIIYNDPKVGRKIYDKVPCSYRSLVGDTK